MVQPSPDLISMNMVPSESILSVSMRTLKISEHQSCPWMCATIGLRLWHAILHMVVAAASGVFQPVHPDSSSTDISHLRT